MAPQTAEHSTPTTPHLAHVLTDVHPHAFPDHWEAYRKAIRTHQLDLHITLWAEPISLQYSHPLIVPKELADVLISKTLQRQKLFASKMTSLETAMETQAWQELTLWWKNIINEDIMAQQVALFWKWFIPPYVYDCLLSNDGISVLEEQSGRSYFHWLYSLQQAAIEADHALAKKQRFVGDPFLVFDELKHLANNKPILFLWVDSLQGITSKDHLGQATLLWDKNSLPINAKNIFKKWNEWRAHIEDTSWNIVGEVKIEVVYSRIIPWSLRKLENQLVDQPEQLDLLADFFNDSSITRFGHPMIEIAMNKKDIEGVIQPGEYITEPWTYFLKQIDGNSGQVEKIIVSAWSTNRQVPQWFVAQKEIEILPIPVNLPNGGNIPSIVELRVISWWGTHPWYIMATRIAPQDDGEWWTTKTNLVPIMTALKHQYWEKYTQNQHLYPHWFWPVFIEPHYTSITDTQRDHATETLVQNGKEKFSQALTALQQAMAWFDETRIIGDISSKAARLKQYGIVSTFWVIHCDTHTGELCDLYLPKPPKSTDEYILDLVDVDYDNLEEQFIRIKTSWKKVFIAMPRANRSIEQLIEKHWLQEQVKLWSPCSFDENMIIENKTTFIAIQDHLADKWLGYISSFIYEQWSTYRDLLEKLWLPENHPIYIQIWLSAGWDGTWKIQSQKELEDLFLLPKVTQAIEEQQLKVCEWITWGFDAEAGVYKEPYPANFQACNIPDGKWWVKVYIEPGSHKPVWLPSMWFTTKSGVGNDWSQPWSSEVNQQAIDIITAMWEYLRQQYGYTGMRWPDCLIGEKDGKTTVVSQEINPREQWTSVQQIYNAEKNNRVPLHFVHTLLKLWHSKEEIVQLMWDPETYNQKSLNSTWWFYIKLMQPHDKEKTQDHIFEVAANVTWTYLINADNEDDPVITLYEKLSDQEIMTGVRENWLPIELPNGFFLINVKWPKPWTQYPNNGSVSKVWTISWVCTGWKTIFKSMEPDITPLGMSLFKYFSSRIFKHNA